MRILITKIVLLRTVQLQINFRIPIRNFQRDFEELCGMSYFLYKDRLKESGCQLGSFFHNLLKKIL